MSANRLLLVTAMLLSTAAFATAAQGETTDTGAGSVPVPETRPVIKDGVAEQSQDC